MTITDTPSTLTTSMRRRPGPGRSWTPPTIRSRSAISSDRACPDVSPTVTDTGKRPRLRVWSMRGAASSANAGPHHRRRRRHHPCRRRRPGSVRGGKRSAAAQRSRSTPCTATPTRSTQPTGPDRRAPRSPGGCAQSGHRHRRGRGSRRCAHDAGRDRSGPRQRSPATRSPRHHVRRLGQPATAQAAFERAAHLAATDADRRFLAQQIQELAEDGALMQRPPDGSHGSSQTEPDRR
jgi:hypothetical protein